MGGCDVRILYFRVAAMAGSLPLSLDPTVIDEIADRLIDAIVERVVEAIRSEGNVRPTREATAWLDAREVAQRLGVSREWVYEHAEELGASRIGTGPRPRLRFAPTCSKPGQASGRPPKRPADRRSGVPNPTG